MTDPSPGDSPLPFTFARRVTILQVLPALVAGGAERGAIDVAAAIVKAGGRALVVSSGGPLVRELERAGGEHIALPVHSKNPLTIRRNAGRLARLIRRHNVDLIHARSRAPAWSAYWAARRTGIPFVTTFHAAYKFQSRWKQRYNAIMAKGDRMIAVSHFIAGYMRDNYAVDPAKMVTIPRGVDLARFNRPRLFEERVVKLVRAWRVPDDLPVLLLPGRLSRGKGHAVLIEALALRAARDVYTVIVGATADRDSYRQELEALIRARGLDGYVRIVERCSDMPAAYGLAALVVAPSIVPEGLGRVPLEAQAMGKPVIASNLGGLPETIVDGVTGLLVPPDDPAALAEAIDQVLALDQPAREGLAERAEANIAAHFTNERMCRETLQVYAELLGR
jgi:glycosyltransferase involved in cell wall biosynthesis